MNNDNVIYLRITGNSDDPLSVDKGVHKMSQGGMFICFKGEARFLLDDTPYVIRENMMVVYFPYSTLEVTYRSDDVDGLVMAIELDAVQPLLSKITDIDSVLLIRQNPLAKLSEENLQRIREYIRLYEHHTDLSRFYAQNDFKRFWQLNNIQLENVKTNLILQVFLVYSHVDSELKNSVNRRDEIVRKFLGDLQRYYIDQHDVGFYADQQCISMRYFSFVVKDRTGKTPSQWIASALVNDAKHMLTGTNYTIKEISDQLRFPNQSYFGKWFKNIVGMGPMEYKKIENYN